MDATFIISRGSILTSKSGVQDNTLQDRIICQHGPSQSRQDPTILALSQMHILTSHYRLESAIKASQSTAGKQPAT